MSIRHLETSISNMLFEAEMERYKTKVGEFRKYAPATFTSSINAGELSENTDIAMDQWYTHPSVLDDDGKEIPFIFQEWDGGIQRVHLGEFLITFQEIPTPEGGDRRSYEVYNKIVKLLKDLME